ncbi:hypothetical protein C2845_PM05G19130, partial [Panicum miliaceum]
QGAAATDGGGRRGEPAWWLEIAGKLLAARDLVGCKRLAERTVEADLNLPGADELLVVADVLLATQRQLPSGRPDPVAVLQLQPGSDPAAVKHAFARLSQLVSAPARVVPETQRERPLLAALLPNRRRPSLSAAPFPWPRG